jgi:hypothetical protein
VWNLVQLNALMQAVFYNEGMQTLMDDFSGKFRRINDLITAFRGIRCLPLIGKIIDKFCKVCVPHPGGPIFASLMEHYGLNFGTNSTTNWGVAMDLDRGVTAGDVIKLILDDIELSFEEITGQSSDAGDRADYRLIVNIMAALGFPTAVVPERRLEVDGAMWSEMQFYELFAFFDTKGIGDDTQHFHPVVDSADDVIHRACPSDYTLDFLDFIGFLPSACSVTEDTSGDYVLYGILNTSPTTPSKLVHRVYTPEDGWFSTVSALDLTAADSLQDYIWSMPWITRHIFGAMAISSEDPEEEYFLYGPGMMRNQEWIQQHDHIGEAYYLALHKSEYGGFDIPIIH